MQNFSAGMRTTECMENIVRCSAAWTHLVGRLKIQTQANTTVGTSLGQQRNRCALVRNTPPTGTRFRGLPTSPRRSTNAPSPPATDMISGSSTPDRRRDNGRGYGDSGRAEAHPAIEQLDRVRTLHLTTTPVSIHQGPPSDSSGTLFHGPSVRQEPHPPKGDFTRPEN